MRIQTDHPGLVELAGVLGHEVVAGDPSGVDVLLLAGPQAWSRVRGLRSAGHMVPIVVLTDSAPALDRARLEPVVLLRTAEEHALAEALQMCAVGRPAGRVPLASGVADLDLGRFEPREGEQVALSPLECRFVGYLAARSGRPASREELQLQVWDHRRALATRAVDMLVARLRRKIEADPKHPASLLTAAGGYRLLVDPGHRQPDEVPSSLLGRTELLSALGSVWREHRALLLVGPPGVGKSAVARALAAARTERTVRVDCCVSSEHTLRALRLALHLPEATLEQLVRGVDDRCLLVLDGVELQPKVWEHFVAAGPCSLLGTSRRVLGSTVTRRIPPLTQAAAEQLLRRSAERHGVTLSGARVRELLEPLDGLPLAILGAARRLRALGRDGLSTQGVLEPALEEGVSRLTEAQQDLLAALAVPSGCFDAEVAQALAPWSGFEDWVALVDAQLVEPSDGRFRLLRGVRDFARRRRAEAWERALPNHLAWVHRWVADIQRTLRSPEARALVDDLIALEPELERAWSTALDEADVRLVELTLALDVLLQRHGERGARRERVQEALDALDDPVAEARLGPLVALLDRHRDREASHRILRASAETLWTIAPDEAALAASEAARLAMNLAPIGQTVAWLRSLPREGLGQIGRLLLEGRLLGMEDHTEERSADEVQQGLLRIADDLAELGDLAGAVDIALAAAPRLMLTGMGDPVRLVQRVVAWARQLADDVLLGSALASLGSRLGEVLRTDEALAALDEAELLFERVEPMRRWQVACYRGTTLANGARYDLARRVLEDYLGWCRRRRTVIGITDALLWLVGLELDAGEHARARVLADEVVELSVDIPHHRLHGRMYQAQLDLLAGRMDAARAVVDALGADGSYDYERLKIALLQSAVGEAREQELAAIGARMSGAMGAVVRAQHAAVRAGDVEALREAGRHGTLAARVLEPLWAVQLARPW